MKDQPRDISPLFLSQFEVDEAVPFQRHLNRLEVEIGREDYSQLKRVERLDEAPDDKTFAAMVEITERLLKNTQNNYNRELLKRLQARIYLDPVHYSIYYRLPGRCLRFVATWRQAVLQRFFARVPSEDSGWRSCGQSLPGFEGRFLPDAAGGVLMLRQMHVELRQQRPLITASHGPYDPHTLEVTLYFLRTGKGGAALINLGFAGREPLADENLALLEAWGVPLNPSNIDVIYPYIDEHGHPCCYKLEERLADYVTALELTLPELVIDIHGCVGTFTDDRRVVVGLGGLPPFRQPAQIGTCHDADGVLYLQPNTAVRRGLTLVRDLSAEMYVQFCAGSHQCYNFALLGGMQLLGTRIDPRLDTASLLDGEERAFLPSQDLRWLPGAGANALQRIAAHKLNPHTQCLHVEIPTAVRRKIVLKLRSLEIESSLDASGL
ncbi:MAG: hypothetical protein RQ722_06600 [Desulfuromonadales bacterium]|nr:hypothetical protein [Desulfuromonadales bacterium]